MKPMYLYTICVVVMLFLARPLTDRCPFPNLDAVDYSTTPACCSVYELHSQRDKELSAWSSFRLSTIWSFIQWFLLPSSKWKLPSLRCAVWTRSLLTFSTLMTSIGAVVSWMDYFWWRVGGRDLRALNKFPAPQITSFLPLPILIRSQEYFVWVLEEGQC